MKSNLKIVFAGVFTIFLGACATTSPLPVKADIVAVNQNAGADLLRKSVGKLDPALPIISVSFSSVDDLERSSSFGRIASQQVASTFVNSGFTVNEVLFRDSLYVKDGSGEFMLSRNLSKITAAHSVQAVIVGTYAVGQDEIYVSSKVIDARTRMILASNDYTMPLDANLKKLLLND